MFNKIRDHFKYNKDKKAVKKELAAMAAAVLPAVRKILTEAVSDNK